MIPVCNDHVFNCIVILMSFTLVIIVMEICKTPTYGSHLQQTQNYTELAVSVLVYSVRRFVCQSYITE